MVKIAISGGSGNVGQEIVDGLAATQKHEIIILSRKDAPATAHKPNISWVKVDYSDLGQLENVLQGVDTVLSFAIMNPDVVISQKNLIQACIRTGVRRFAPSEWVTPHTRHLPWYKSKEEIRNYLEDLNKDKKVLEYTLFHPGIFVNYLTYPYKSSTHITPLGLPFDFNKRRAVLVDGGEEERITLTTVKDLANIVVQAIDYKQEWPVYSGIKGDELTISQIIAIGEKLRGKFTIEKLKREDLEAGEVKSSWVSTVEHPSFTPEEAEKAAKPAFIGLNLAFGSGDFNVSDEWNQLLPDYKFTKAEQFLTEFWSKHP